VAGWVVGRVEEGKKKKRWTRRRRTRSEGGRVEGWVITARKDRRIVSVRRRKV